MFDFDFAGLFLHGGFTLILLIGCSILSIKVIIEKWVVLGALDEKNMNIISEDFKKSFKMKDYKEAIQICKNATTKKFSFTVSSPLAIIYYYILKNLKYPKDELLELSFTKLDQEMVQMEKGLGILATLGNISPFIGLFGTVLGIIKSFQGMSSIESSGYISVMSGIAEALISTAAGLVVAVPSVIFYNYFIKKIKRSIPYIEREIKEIVFLLKKGSS
ncbi:MotA/TolQ/ExbB proton channel family protein [Stygiobacter electus]|uniref:MotA/TolQ/ExbB proton channel family protein n=1 Tax=Stygiobacter electus TaxID=3032292 RepID=A0AAE3P2N3_9BACT|nr:MotA/TolQ/ExbB proton channel family protein [Stygiobacter electus]MDF1613304.1 MotA/TolQ/ExbB proton channel family protein [Stygiobacter electus]